MAPNGIERHPGLQLLLPRALVVPAFANIRVFYSRGCFVVAGQDLAVVDLVDCIA
jgi:hypothetical protein